MFKKKTLHILKVDNKGISITKKRNVYLEILT